MSLSSESLKRPLLAGGCFTFGGLAVALPGLSLGSFSLPNMSSSESLKRPLDVGALVTGAVMAGSCLTEGLAGGCFDTGTFKGLSLTGLSSPESLNRLLLADLLLAKTLGVWLDLSGADENRSPSSSLSLNNPLADVFPEDGLAVACCPFFFSTLDFAVVEKRSSLSSSSSPNNDTPVTLGCR